MDTVSENKEDELIYVRKLKRRTARDIILDYLPISYSSTFPLNDLPVYAKEDLVMYDHPGVIVIPFSQPDVVYQVFDDVDSPGSETVKGNSRTIELTTHLLTREDYTFHVIATKIASQNQKRLLKTVLIKVDVNVNLLLDVKQQYIDYNSIATVIVHGSQSGALYQVTDQSGKPLSEPKSSGEGGDLEINLTEPLKEDLEVKVRVTNIKNQITRFLTNTLIIKVKPDTGIKYELESPVYEYESNATIIIKDPQSSVTYSARIDDIDDDDNRTLLYHQPIAKGARGSEKELKLVTETVTEDLTISIIASKNDGEHDAILDGSLIIPVKPDSQKNLEVIQKKTTKGESATVRVNKTQRGIIYQLRNASGNEMIGHYGYHHKNYGVGKARIEIELVPGEFTRDFVDLETGPLEKTTTFSVYGVKATTKEESLIGKIKITVTSSNDD